MKTIQEVLRTLNRKDLEGAYFYKYSPAFWELRHNDVRTIKELKEYISRDFQFYVDRLCSMETKSPENEKVKILYAHKQIWDTAWCDDIAIDLIYADEIMDAKDLSEVRHYAYEFAPQEEALGYLVADTKLTQDHLYDVAVNFLNEMAFFGYEQESMEDEMQKLLDAEKEIERYPENLKVTSANNLVKELGLPEDERYPKEDNYKQAVLDKIIDYNTYCKKAELEKIQNMLVQQDFGECSRRLRLRLEAGVFCHDNDKKYEETEQKTSLHKLKHAVRLSKKQMERIANMC